MPDLRRDIKQYVETVIEEIITLREKNPENLRYADIGENWASEYLRRRETSTDDGLTMEMMQDDEE